MILRSPKYEDVGQLIEMGARMHAESAYAFLPYDREKVRRLIVSCIEDPETQCGLVAEEGHVLVGMIAGYLTDYFFCDEKIACDMLLFIDQRYRGGFTAVRLIRGFEQWAVAHDARELCLGVSTNINIESTGKFYERMGFTHVGGVYKRRLERS